MTRIAVIQPALKLGEVQHNLERVEELIIDATGSLAHGLRHRRGGFPWQSLPTADLPDEIGPGDLVDART